MNKSTDISRKEVPVTVVKAVEGDESVIRFIASTNNIDRDGDIIDQKGWDVSHFMENPVILANHENKIEKIVGKATRVEVQEDKMIIDVKFAKDESDLANLAWRLYKNGFASAVSVGFLPDFDSITTKEVGDKMVMVIGKAELLELSMVAVQSNREALAVRSKEEFSTKEASTIKKTWGIDLGIDEEDKSDKELFALKFKVVCENHENQKHLMKHFAKINKTIGYVPSGDFQKDISESYSMLKECLTGGYTKGLSKDNKEEVIDDIPSSIISLLEKTIRERKSVRHSETQSGEEIVETNEKPSEEETTKFLENLIQNV